MAVSREVTVVVPTRNRAEMLAVTLRSILGQHGADLRVVVVDEASTDGTPGLLERLADQRVEVLRHEVALGVAAARNAGLARVRTRWVAFCDDDDVWSPEKLRLQLDAVEGCGWCCTGAVLVDESLQLFDHQRPPSGDVLDLLLAGNGVPGGGSSVLAGTNLLQEVGGFCEDLRNSEDWDLWIRLAERSPLAAVDRPLVGYRVWPASKSHDATRMVRAWELITARHRELAAARRVTPSPWDHQRYLAREQVRSRHRMLAARGYSRVARHGGDPRQWVRVAGAIVAPAVMDRVGTARASRRVPPSWRTEADAWLADLRAAGGVLGTAP